MYEIEPKSVKEILSEKGITIGQIKVKYGESGSCSLKTTLKPKDKYVFFRGSTITKQVPKKDITEIEVKFSKIYNINFALGPLKLVIDEDAMPSVKIIKTSKDKINLDSNLEQVVKFSIICLKSGFFQLKGITLTT